VLRQGCPIILDILPNSKHKYRHEVRGGVKLAPEAEARPGRPMWTAAWEAQGQMRRYTANTAHSRSRPQPIKTHLLPRPRPTPRHTHRSPCVLLVVVVVVVVLVLVLDRKHRADALHVECDLLCILVRRLERHDGLRDPAESELEHDSSERGRFESGEQPRGLLEEQLTLR